MCVISTTFSGCCSRVLNVQIQDCAYKWMKGGCGPARTEREMDMDECFRCARARYESENEGADADGEFEEGVRREESWVGYGGKEEKQNMWERWAREQGKRWPIENRDGVQGRGKARIPLWYREYAPGLWVGVGM